MAVQLALSVATLLTPQATPDLAALSATLTRLGLAGIEIPTPDVAALPALLTDAAATRRQLATANLSVAALTTSLTLDADERTWQTTLALARKALDAAAAVGASVVRVLGLSIQRGQTRNDAYARIAARLRTLAELAAPLHIRIALQNAGSFTAARDLWNILQLTDHPHVGAAWSLAAGIAAGEDASLSVPTLNSGLAYTSVWDAAAAAPRTPVLPGTGAVKIAGFIERLRGIGYTGWVTYAPPVTAPLDADHLYAAARIMRAAAGLPELTPDGQPAPKVEEKPATPAPAKPAAKPPAAAKPAAAPPPAPADADKQTQP